MTANANEARLRRAAKRLGLTLRKDRQTGLWWAHRYTVHGTLRIESDPTGLDYAGMARWLDARREGKP